MTTARLWFAVILCLFIVPLSIPAEPILQIDNLEFDFGPVPVKDAEVLTHTFKVSNPGDKQIRFSSVRPNCSCLTVELDTIILPHSTGKIVGTLRLPSGTMKFEKSVRIISNAKNNSITLFLRGTILNSIGVSEKKIKFKKDGERLVKATAEILTPMKDLVIQKIEFKQHEATAPGWQNEGPLPIKFTTVRSEKSDPTGLYTYAISMSLDILLGKEIMGYVKIFTNHPEKPILSLRGTIEATEDAPRPKQY